MFGSTNPFGQSSSSPFGSSVFGQTSSTATNPFAPKPFGSSNPFGPQTGSSIFGGTSTGVFGQASTPTFGASSSPAFGTSVPAFGASSTPAFGSSSSSFGSSLFGQKPAFGGFGSSQSQSSPFNSTFQQSQPSFGNNLFGSTPSFGSSSQPAFGAGSTSAFGSTNTVSFGSTAPFGATSNPVFGVTTTPPFGSTTSSPFGSTSTSIFGSSGASFGVSSTPAFGSTGTPAFGAPLTSVFGSSSAPAFGASTAPTFGSPTAPAFGASSSASFSFGSAPSFGQSTSAFGSSPFGTTSSPFGAQSSAFGVQATTPTFGNPGFGQTAFGGQVGGTRIAAYAPTPEIDGGSGTQPAGKLEVISAMPAYKDKSHEELRWEDYQRGDKGGPNPAGQPSIGFSTATQPSPFASTGTFGQPAGNAFSSAASSNPFATKTPGFGSSGFGSASSSSLFSSSFSGSSLSPFGATSTTSVFGAPSANPFNSSPSPFATTASAFSSPSIFGSSLPGSSSSFNTGLTFGNTQPSGLFQSSSSSFGQTPSLFGQPNTGFQQTSSAFGSNLFSSQSTGFGGGHFSSSAPSTFPSSTPAGFGQTASFLQTPFQMAPVAQTSSAFSFTNFGQSQPASSSGFGGNSNIFSQGSFGQSAASQSNMLLQPAPITNPFGTLPAVPQMAIGQLAPSVQYGISAMPVAEKPVLVRSSLILVPRYLSPRRIKLPPRKYNPKDNSARVPFYAEDAEAPSTPKADALFIPRENPRVLIIRPIEQWPPWTSAEKPTMLKEITNSANGNEIPTENGYIREQNETSPSKSALMANGFHDDHAENILDSTSVKISGHRAGEAAIVFQHGADIEAQMPKLRHPEYYTEPRIQELAAKERAEPGFSRHVKDFVIGRHGYGCIKFNGETDVRRLDLEPIVQFNNREVIVYRDETKKPPVGQGLNKPAEVTLLNIKCMNKKTGQPYTQGPKLEKYKEMLMKKAEEQGAEFLSYDPIKGEWKFKVKHFSFYGFGDMDM